MAVRVDFTDDPARVLTRASEFLVSEPVLHNLVLTILDARVTHPESGGYWVGIDGGSIAGVVLQSPHTFPATITPMSSRVVEAMVEAIAAAGVALPGVNGEAATAAIFAGQWTERCGSAASPFQGNRLYELAKIGEPPRVAGKLRRATTTQRDLMIDWTRAFNEETGEEVSDLELRVDRGLAAGQLWLWEDGEPVSMALARAPMEGVVRVSNVYTPPEKRRKGYAEACVYALSKQLSDAGYRSMLYTDLANPTSNSIYRRIGYRAVAEVLRYRFE